MGTHTPVEPTRKGTEPVGLPVERVCRVLEGDDGGEELLHGVAVEVRDPEAVPGGHPARGDDGEVDDRGRGLGAVVAGRQHGEEAGVVLVKDDVAHGAEPAEVVLVWVRGAVPADDVKGCVVLFTVPQFTHETCDDGPLFFWWSQCRSGLILLLLLNVTLNLLVDKRLGDLKVPDIGQSCRPDDAQIGKTEVALVEFTYISPTRFPLREADAVADVPGHHGDLVLPHEEPPELGLDVQRPGLGDDEDVTVEGRKCLSLRHVLGDAEYPQRRTVFPLRVAVPTNDLLSVDPVRFFGHGQRVPLVRVGCDIFNPCL